MAVSRNAISETTEEYCRRIIILSDENALISVREFASIFALKNEKFGDTPHGHPHINGIQIMPYAPSA